MPSLSSASANIPHVDEKDLYFGEAYYYACQGNYVDAIARQDIALLRFYGRDKSRPYPLHIQFGRAGYSVGDFELSYRMPQRAGRIVKAILENNTDQSVRNEARFRLAGIFMQQGDPGNALATIEQISGEIPEDIREDELYLRSQIYMDNGNFAGAVRSLQKLQSAKNYKGFAAYNLGVALIKIGQEKQGLDQLEKAGKISGDDEVTLSIREKANLMLGYRLIENKQPVSAKQYLERVRLTGPFSNKALLGLGWADVALGHFDSALAPWTVLAKRSVTDKSVQESMLGVPYAYAQLNLPGKAAKFYGKALDEYDKELNRLEASIKSVSEGKLQKVLLNEKTSLKEGDIAKLRALPESPETYYLIALMASSDFQGVMENYLDLEDLSKRLEFWDEYPNSFAGLRPSSSPNNQGYDEQARQLKSRVHDSRQKVGDLMNMHGRMLEKIALGELEQRRKYLLELQNQARLGLTDSYERASKAQVPSSGAK